MTRLLDWLRALGEGGYFGGTNQHGHSSADDGGTLARTVAIPSTDQAAAKAWAHWDATPTIQASMGVSSITKTSAGRWLITFTSAFASTNYAAFGFARADADAAFHCFEMLVFARTTTQIEIRTSSEAGVSVDTNRISLVVFA